LPGVGEVLAQRIVAYRDKNGPFQSIDDLAKIKNLRASVIEQFRDQTTVSGSEKEPPATDGKLNLNTATAKELEALPGIGEILSQRIVDYRRAHGSYRSVTDLTKVEGVRASVVEKLSSLVTTGRSVTGGKKRRWKNPERHFLP
jgi:competence ComEA-like helix-hairpin-helix protein